MNDGRGSDESLTRTASGSGTCYLDLEACAGSGPATYACNLSTA
ncbi:hypothetical protein [Streptomyces collinus]|nr:hypothetical protein [Streptomyces collinus]